MMTPGKNSRSDPSLAETLAVALIRDVFHGEDGEPRLRLRLADARARGAEVALLPELPLDRWAPATPDAREDDAEEPGGRRHRILAAAARDAGIGLIGGAIVRDPERGERRNTALCFDARGVLAASYAKLHLPDEPGFREPCHYRPGDRPPEVTQAFGMPLGIQICSDMNRPEGSHLLAAQGAEAILNPRATEAATWERWKLVLRATALTTATYVLSVARPAPEQGVPLGGPSLVVDPDGTVLVETREPVATIVLHRTVTARARQGYPGYLAVRAELYAEGWSSILRRLRG
jgi:predicted amidohydrolase